MPNAQLFFSDQLMCSLLTKTVTLMWTVHTTPLSLSQSPQCLILPFLFSLSPSLHLSLPHCPQLHLFLSTLQMIAGSFPLLFTLQLSCEGSPTADSLPLSLLPRPLSLPQMSLFYRPCCSLSTPWCRPSHRLWSAVTSAKIHFYCVS